MSKKHLRHLYFRALPRRTILTASLYFEPRDLWVGVFWDRWSGQLSYGLDIYLTLIPTLPIKIEISRAYDQP